MRMFDCRQLGSELLAEDVEWVNPPDAVEPGRGGDDEGGARHFQ